MTNALEKKESKSKVILYHLITIVITLYGVIKKSVIFFLTAYITVILSIFFTVGMKVQQNVSTEIVFMNLYDTSSISTILSTLVCFLVSLYYIVNKPEKNNTFVTVLWLFVIIAVFLFAITLLELFMRQDVFNMDLKFYTTYTLLFFSFLLTIYVKADAKDLKKKYSNQLISIKSKFMSESSYNGKSLKV